MARGRRGNADASNDDAADLVSIKSTLNAILQPQYANQVKEIIFERCVTMTEISSLAYLLLLTQTNSAVDRNDSNFFLQDGQRVIFSCFDAVTSERMGEMPQTFHDDMNSIHEYQYQWPSKTCMGNSYQYFREQYITNLKTNFNTHLEKILTHFLRIRCYDENRANPDSAYNGIDIRNVLKDVLKDQDWTDGDRVRQDKKRVLIQHLVGIGFPANVNIRNYVKDNWFASIWPFIHIQRVIESFLIDRADAIEQWKLFSKDPKKYDKPNGIRPPTVHNFTAIPNCNFHLKHIKIDTAVCYWLTGKLKSTPKYTSPKTGKPINVPLEYYTSKKLTNNVKAQRQAELFDVLFNMDKIRRNGKHAKSFYGQIVTDGESASVIYEREKRSTFFCLIMILASYWQGLYLNVIGIDPGDKTWLAGVRRNIWTRAEVSSVN